MTWADAFAEPAPLPCAVQAFRRSLASSGNPSSLHRLGQAGRRDLDAARAAIASFFVADPSSVEVILCGSTAEASTLAAASSPVRCGDASSIYGRAMMQGGPGACEVVAPFDDRDFELGELPTGDSACVLDASFALGRVDLHPWFARCGVAWVASPLSGGVQPVAALVVRKGQRPAALWGGGGQEHGVRSGSQPAPAFAAWAAALGEWPSVVERARTVARSLRASLDNSSVEIIGAAAEFGVFAVRLAEGLEAETELGRRLPFSRVGRDGARPVLRWALDHRAPKPGDELDDVVAWIQELWV